MADLNATIKNIVKGDTYDVVRTIDNIPSGEVITTAWFTIKPYHWSTTNTLQKTITTTYSSSVGGITDTGAGDGIAAVIFHLQASETVVLSEYFRYSYDIQVKTQTDKIYTPESGYLICHHSVTSNT